MVIVDAFVAFTLLVLVSVAALAAVAILGSPGSLVHHRRRVSRHESIPSYYRHLAVGH